MKPDFHASRIAPLGRREFLAGLAASAAVAAGSRLRAQGPRPRDFPRYGKAQIVITLDLEMSRNFPDWEDTHWDYEKGNLNQAAKDYTVAACQRVKSRGGLIHNFVVGQVLEHADVQWLKTIADGGHPIGNHTYDHVYLLAQSPEAIQYRFARAPWLLGQRSIAEVLRSNVALCSAAMKERLGITPNGFRTPGGFADGLEGRADIQQMLLGLGFDWISCRYPPHAGIEDLHGTGRRPSQKAFDEILAAQPLAQPLVYDSGLIDLPMSPISDIGAFRNGRWKLDDFLAAVRMAVEWAIDQRAMFDFLAHPSCLGVVDPKFRTLDLICDLVEQSQDRAEIVTLDVVAERARPQLTGV